MSEMSENLEKLGKVIDAAAVPSGSPTRHCSERDAVNVVRENVNKALGGSWIVAVGRPVVEGGKIVDVQVSRTSWKFPADKFNDFCGKLWGLLAREVPPDVPPEPEPLEMADFVLDAVAAPIEFDGVNVGDHAQSVADLMRNRGERSR